MSDKQGLLSSEATPHETVLPYKQTGTPGPTSYGTDQMPQQQAYAQQQYPPQQMQQGYVAQPSFQSSGYAPMQPTGVPDPYGQQPQQPGYQPQMQPQNGSGSNVIVTISGGKGRSMRGSYRTGLCGCFEDICACLWGCCCPCIASGSTVDNIYHNGFSYGACLYTFCCYKCGVGSVRTQVHAKYGIHEGCCKTFCITCCCPCCGIIQDLRESRTEQ